MEAVGIFRGRLVYFTAILVYCMASLVHFTAILVHFTAILVHFTAILVHCTVILVHFVASWCILRPFWYILRLFWYILRPSGTFHGHLVHFTAILVHFVAGWYICWSFRRLLIAAAEEMKRAAVDLKLPGFQIGSHVGEWNLDAKELYPIYKVIHPSVHRKPDSFLNFSGRVYFYFFKFYFLEEFIFILFSGRVYFYKYTQCQCISSFDNSTAVYKDLKTLHPGGIRTRELLFWRRTR
jgi:hypothetical protein